MSSHKEQADVSFKGGDYQAAVSHYSNAIEEIKGGEGESKEGKEKLKKLYSNRSSAYQQQKAYDMALADANLCISCDPQWHKGYVQKGNCLTYLRKPTEAYNAYNAALRISPNDKDVQKKCEEAEERIRKEAERSSNSSSSSSFFSNSNSSGSNNNGGGGGGYQVAQGWLGKLQMYARVALFFSFTVASLPFVSFLLGRNLGALLARVSLYTFLASALASSVIRLYLLFGMPKLSAEYASKVAKHPLGMNFFLIFIAGFAGRFYLMLGLPLVAPEATFYTRMMLEEAPKLLPLLDQYIPASMRAQVEQAIANLARPGAADLVNDAINKLAGTAEVMAGVFFVLELLMPTRNLVVTYLYWQYLGMRYANDKTGAIRDGFSQLDKQIRFFTDHKYCPAIVSKAYGMLIKVLQGQAQKFKPGGAAAAAGGGGIGGMFSKLTSKCTIA